jgi:hypothetical protein
MENILNTGALLLHYFTKNRIRKAALARKLNKNISNIMYYQKQPSLQTQILWELSHVLEHNFFLDIAAQLPNTYSTSAPTTNIKDTTIAQLQQEITILKAEKEVVLQAFKK